MIPGPGGLATLYQIAAVRGDVWAGGQGGPTGYGPQIAEWNGHAWLDRTPAGLNTGQIATIGMSSPDNVWAAAGNVGNYALRWDGHKWTRFAFRESVLPHGLAVLSSANVWIFGEAGQYQPFVRHYDGHRWHSVASPVVPLSVSTVAPHDIWTVGALDAYYPLNPNHYPSALANWNGWHWHEVALPNLHLSKRQSFQPYGIAATGPKDAWVIGEVTSSDGVVLQRSFLLHWTGKYWKSYASPVNLLAQIAADGRGGVWMTADPLTSGRADLVHFRYGRWNVTPAPLPAGQPGAHVDLYGIVNIRGTTSEWAGGFIAPQTGLPAGIVDVFGS
jgi:hypothetical protein